MKAFAEVHVDFLLRVEEQVLVDVHCVGLEEGEYQIELASALVLVLSLQQDLAVNLVLYLVELRPVLAVVYVFCVPAPGSVKA